MSFYWHEEWWSPEDAEEISRWISGEMHKQLGIKEPIGVLHMGDADSARMAKALANLDRHMGEMVKVLAAINENMVAVGKTFNAWLEVTNVEVDITDNVESPLDESVWPSRMIQFRVKLVVENVLYDELVATGLLKERPDGTYEIDVRGPDGVTSHWAVPPSGQMKLSLQFVSQIYHFAVPSFESGITEVYGSIDG